MSTQPEALRLADELEMWTLGEPAAVELRRLHAENVELREAIKRAVRIEQAQPVAWQWLSTAYFRKNLPKDAKPGEFTPLYTAQPQRKPLTDEEIKDLYGDNNNFDITGPYVIAFARAIEAAHGIRE